MLLRNRRIDRRTVLRGLGTALALPMLEAMLPNDAAAAASARPRRLSVFYTPNGMIMKDFVPATSGTDYAMTATLEPLAAHRSRFSVISGLAHYQASALGDGPGSHGRSCGAFLTGAHPKRTEGSDLHCGVSMDQLVAQRWAAETQLASLELGIEPPSLLGSCDVGYSCTYTNTLSWKSDSVALPVTVNPRDVFERLFGDGDALDAASRRAQLATRSSILDFVREDAMRLSGQLDAHDRQKMDGYLDSVRDVERRIARAANSDLDVDAGTMTRPAGIPEKFEDHVRMMIDLQVLALQADLTRVCTFMLGRELSNRAYPEIGISDAHHMLSHHGGDPAKIVKLAQINRLHLEQFGYFLDRMAATSDGEGSLLDSTLVLAGASLGEPNEHDNMNLPILIAGADLPGGRHIAVPQHTPMANLMLTMLQSLDVDVAAFGDSSGTLDFA